MRQTPERRFIDECHAWNPWWEGDYEELSQVTHWQPRSDLFVLLSQLNDIDGDTPLSERIIGCYGQTGIGKTTLLKQLAATLMDTAEAGYTVERRDYDLVGSIEPGAVLYLPVEESLYQLEQAEDALDLLKRVVEYHRTRVAASTSRQFLFIDDIGVLDADPEKIGHTLADLIDDNLSIIYTTRVRDQVAFENGVGVQPAETIPLLPVKFIDFAQMQSNSSRADELETLQAGKSEDARDDPDVLTLQDVRRPLENDNPDAVEFAHRLERLYFESIDAEERNQLIEHARKYFRYGGFPRQFTVGEESAVADKTTNQLTRSNLELFLFKELAQSRSIHRPDNLLQLCGLAASVEATEYGYRELASRLDVDRRTVRNYIEALEDAIILTESTDYTLQRHRQTRLHLREPRHVIVLSQRHAHEGFESVHGSFPYNPTFERLLCRTVVFDHAMRLTYNVDLNRTIEFVETAAGDVEYILRDGSTVLPFALGYEPREGDAAEAVTTFDPDSGSHNDVNGSYRAPMRFVVTDSVPTELRDEQSLITTVNGIQVCYLPFSVFMLVC